MPASDPKNLVSTAWLHDHLEAPDLRIVDASWDLPGSGGNPKTAFEAEHIPGAVFFDIDEIADTGSPYPHMLPAPEKFSSRVRKLGLGDGSRIVVYDSAGLFSAARVWWMFRVMGHNDVAVLNGGLPKWTAEGRPVSDHKLPPRERHFTARFNNFLVKSVDDVQAASKSGRAQIIDARSAARFEGTEPEPREGLRSGHIPGARSLPFSELLDTEGVMIPAEDLAGRFAGAGVDMKRPVITSCGSGVTAAVLALALDILGHRHVGLYDGSWSEWGARNDLPLETGPVKQ